MKKCKHRLYHLLGQECECIPPYVVLVAFAAWLTTRKEPITFSATTNASQAVTLVEAFCESQGWKRCGYDYNWFVRWFNTTKPYPKI